MKNLTTGHSLKLIFFFALPLMFGNLLQQLYIMVDTMIVGRFVGVDALASIGGADWINWAILGLLMGFTQGFSIRVSNCLGANDEKGMEKSIAMSYLSCFVIAILVIIFSQIIIEPLLKLLNTPSHTIQGSITYLRIMSGGALIVIFYNCFSSILRAIGDSRTPLIAMVIAACLNVILDLLFVCIFHQGIAGAAIATLISQLFAATFCYFKLRKELPFKIKKETFQIDQKLIYQLIKLGLPLAFQNLIIAFGGIVLQSVVNDFGFLFIAGYTATNKLYGILEVVAISFGYAITTFVSQNYGAKKYDRVLEAYHFCLKVGVVLLSILGIICFIFAPEIIALFRKEDLEVIEIGTVALRYQCLTLPIQASIVMANMLTQSIGYGFWATLVAMGRQGIFLIPALFILPNIFGIRGLQYCQPFADICTFIVGLLVVRKVIGDLKANMKKN